jgi:HK97 family phage major capsid protein/HK97 family phage prohead protease
MTTTIRAWSTFELKALDEYDDDKGDKRPRRFSGIATTPSVDRAGDIVEPEGAEFALPIPFLWQHNSADPVGWITSAKVTAKGITIEGEVASVDEPPALKSRLEEAWAMMKAGLVRGLSIGFQSLESARIEGSYARRYIKWSWLELSAVTIPMNGDASITGIKAADTAVRKAADTATRSPASGTTKKRASVSVSAASKPGDSGSRSATHNSAAKGQAMKISEQLAAFDTRRKSATERMDELMSLAGQEGRTLDESETEEYDGLAADLKSIDAHVERLKAHESTMVARAVPVTAGAGRPDTAGSSVDIGRGPISVRRNLPQGTAFTRYAMALAVAKGNLMQAERLSQVWKDTPEVNIVLRAAVDAGTTSDTTWAGPLVQYQDLVSEFVDLLRNATILGRMGSVRRVPFNVRIPRKTNGATGSFVGEGAPVPVREVAFDNILLPWSKASAIVVITAELARLSNPSAEALVRQDLIDGIAEFLDKRLIDPAFAGVANVSPPSLTNGVTPRAASGATLAAIDDDVGAIMQAYASTNQSLATGVWVMSPSLAITLSLLRTNQDTPAFPGMGMAGGTFYGLPAITSNAVAPSGSPGDQHLILVNQAEVLLADDGQMMIDASMEASLQMNDAPSTGAQSLVSLWQNGLVGVKVDRWIYWTKRRSGAVQYIDGAQRYGS